MFPLKGWGSACGHIGAQQILSPSLSTAYSQADSFYSYIMKTLWRGSPPSQRDFSSEGLSATSHKHGGWFWMLKCDACNLLHHLLVSILQLCVPSWALMTTMLMFSSWQETNLHHFLSLFSLCYPSASPMTLPQDQLLFCDDCDRGYHMYCLNPPVFEPPEGNIFWKSALKTAIRSF